MVSGGDRLRNIGIVAHINAGKTTLSERILFDTGKQRWVGDVESGTATMDWMVEEQRRGISITAAVTSVSWRNHRINLIDTPGHVDFTAEVERCLRVLDGVVVLLDGVRGVESQTEAVWRRAQKQGLPCLVFVNKLDRAFADFDQSVESVRRVFGCRTVVVSRPLFDDDGLVGVVDVVTGEVVGDAPPPDAVQLHAWRQDVVEVCADFDPGIFEDFVEGVEVEPARLRRALRKAVGSQSVVAVFAGAALRDLGVNLLLDGVVDLLPSPGDGEDFDGFSALLYKVHVGDDVCSGYLRVFSGVVSVGDTVEIASTGAPLVVSELWRSHANEHEDADDVGAGDFAAVALPMPLRTGETLRAPGSAVVLEEMRFSEPVLTMTLEPRTSDGREELEARARAMSFEDPTLEVRRDPSSGQLLVSGMGELHLEVFGSRLNRRLAEPARFGRPAVTRYETVAGPGVEAAELARRVAGDDYYARATVEVEPREPGSGVEVRTGLDSPVAEEVRAELEVLAQGGIAAPSPARDLRIRLTELELRGEGAFLQGLATEAAISACRRAVTAAGRVVLEPIVEFVVEGPSESFSAVLGDLRSRGAEIGSVVPGFGSTKVEGAIPLAALLGYAGPLRSMTQGKGSLRFALARFAAVEGQTGQKTRPQP